jgi:hemolysin III
MPINNRYRHFQIEEKLNSWSHGLTALAALGGFVVLIVFSLFSSKNYALLSVLFYGIGLFAVFLSSALYHGIEKEPLKEYLRKIDHSCIYLLIAGTYTPVLLISIGGAFGWTFFGIMWGMALLGIFLKMRHINRFELAALIMYAVMGWLALIKIEHLYNHLAGYGFWLLMSGGLSYTLGIVFFVLDKRMLYSHFIWHIFVIAGALLHYLMIVWYVI